MTGLVTMQTIRDITNTTDECRSRISGKDIPEDDGMQVVVGMDGLGQSVLSAGHGDEDGEEIEAVATPFPSLPPFLTIPKTYLP